MPAPATYEVNYLQPIAFGKTGFSPFLVWYDGTIQFDGDSIRFHAKMFKK